MRSSGPLFERFSHPMPCIESFHCPNRNGRPTRLVVGQSEIFRGLDGAVGAQSLKGAAMPLSTKLRDVELTLAYPHCGHALRKSGKWFMVAPYFKCEGRGRIIRITYGDKVALFDKYTP